MFDAFHDDVAAATALLIFAIAAIAAMPSLFRYAA